MKNEKKDLLGSDESYLAAIYRVDVVGNRATAAENRVIAVMECLVFLASHE
jgi:hypothetical protein